MEQVQSSPLSDRIEKSPLRTFFWIVVGAASVLLFLSLFLFLVFKEIRGIGFNTTVCTLEAKQCPDGSYVSRTGPKCEFPTCPTASVPKTLPSNCTSDSECPAGYSCEATEGTGVAYPNGAPPPSPTIIKGICKAQKGGICKTDSDCISSLICHAVTENGATIHKCEEPVLGECDTSSSSVCPSGYQCVQSCGPPVVRSGAPTPASYCTADEIAQKPRSCPICLASNTMISTPNGTINVKDIQVGMNVWSVDLRGNKIKATVVKTSRVSVPSGTFIIHLVLADGRQIWVSPNHPDVFGKPVTLMKIGDVYDGSTIEKKEPVQYWDRETYDLLPGGTTGFYFANGILLGSTLKK